MILSAQVHNLNKETTVERLKRWFVENFLRVEPYRERSEQVEQHDACLVQSKETVAERLTRVRSDQAARHVYWCEFQGRVVWIEGDKFVSVKQILPPDQILPEDQMVSVDQIVSREVCLKLFLDNLLLFQQRHPAEFQQYAHSIARQSTDPIRPKGVGTQVTTTLLVMHPYTYELTEKLVVTSHASCSYGSTYPVSDRYSRQTTLSAALFIGEPNSEQAVCYNELSPTIQQEVLQDLTPKLLPLKRLVDADIIARATEEQQRDRLAQDIIRRHQPPPGE